MRIGIVGSGSMGRALARHLSHAGHDVALANSRGAASLADLGPELGRGVRAADVEDAVQSAQVVLLAIPYKAVGAAARAGEPWDARVVVDLTNFYPARAGDALDPAPEPSRVVVAARLDGAVVAKAFNTIWSVRLEQESRPPGTPGRLAIPVAADDEDARHLVLALVDECGFDGVAAGSLADSWRQQPGTPVFNEPLDAEAVRRALAAAG